MKDEEQNVDAICACNVRAHAWKERGVSLTFDWSRGRLSKLHVH